MTTSPPDFRSAVRTALAGRSVNWLAKTSGVPQSTLAQWLGGVNETISSGSLERVAAALGMDLTRRQSPTNRNRLR